MAMKFECGVFCFHPRCLQRFGSIGWFAFFACFTIVGVHSLLFYLTTQITALERQFGFSSSQTGIMLACNDIGYLAFSLLVGHIAPRVHIPKWLSFTTFLVAAAAFLCTVPYFVARDHIQEESFNRLSKLPDVATIEMVRNLQQQNMAEFSPDQTAGTDFFETEYNTSTPTPYLVTQTGDVDSVQTNDSKKERNGITATSPASAPSSPFLVMLAKFRGFVGDDIYSTLTTRAGIQEGVPPTMPALKRLVKSVASNATILQMLPPQARQRILMFARLSKRSLPREETSVSDIGSLHPFQLMLMIAPRCTAIPKRASNCEMVAKIMNKGITNPYTGLAFALLTIALIILGICKSTRTPMIVLYLDDNGSKAKTPMYLGFLFTAAGLGALLAFGLGVLSSRLYVTMEEVPIHPLNPHWIGAWWLGFLVVGAILFLSAISLVCFPKRLGSTSRYIKPANEPDEKVSRKKGAKTSGKEFLLGLKRCLTNPVLWGVTICGACMFMMFAGILPFAAKYMETQFTIPAWKANLLVGATKIIPGLLGACLTGAVIARLRLSPLAICKGALGCSFCAVVGGSLFFVFGCDTVSIVGYNSDIFQDKGPTYINSTACASACHCQTVDYFPVCGSDDRTYFSACHAGCTGSRGDTEFTECSCIGINGTARLGPCKEKRCKMLIPYMITNALSTVIYGAQGVLFLTLAVRSVPDKDRSLAIATMSLLANLLGWLPAPIVCGKLVDSACMLWRTTCAHLHKGACSVYDIELFRKLFSGYIVFTGVVMTCSMCFVYIKGRNKTDWNCNAKLLPNVSDIEVDGEAGERLTEN